MGPDKARLISHRFHRGLCREWAERRASHLPERGRVLEVAPGPGYLSIELAKRSRSRFTGLEIRRTFLETARRNARSAGVEVEFRLGDAGAMPFENNSFVLLFCASAYRSFSEPARALREMFRVLKPGGKAWIRDLRPDVPEEAIREFVRGRLDANGLAGWRLRRAFRRTLRKRACSSSQFGDLARQAGFRIGEIKHDLVDFEALLEKEAGA